LGDGSIALTTWRAGAVDSRGPTSFTAWAQVIGGETSGYDSFHFSQGSFRGVDAAYWDGIGGDADRFVRVSEPSTLALLLISLVGIGYRRYHPHVR
jgi:hypothetical protein